MVSAVHVWHHPVMPTPVGRFLDWAKRNPQSLTEPAVETVGRFFIAEFPCRPK